MRASKKPRVGRGGLENTTTTSATILPLATYPSEMIDYGAKSLKPMENNISNYLKLWDNLDNPPDRRVLARHEHLGHGSIPPDGGAFRHRGPVPQRSAHGRRHHVSRPTR